MKMQSVEKPSMPVRSCPPATAAGTGSRPVKFILYVDDWPPLLEIVKKSLERNGDMIVETALSMTDACLKLKNPEYDLVIMDYNYKDGDRIDLLSFARKCGITIPFVFFILEQQPAIEDSAKTWGNVFFVKKFSESLSGIDDLELAIREILGSPGSLGKRSHSPALKGSPS